MSLSQSLNAYSDCRRLFELANADGKGCRAQVPDYSAATYLRLRMHQFRKLDREHNAKVYPFGHHLHDHSVHDQWTIRIYPEEGETGKYWVYLELAGRDILQVETLTDELTEAEFLAQNQPKFLEPPKPAETLTSDLSDDFANVETLSDASE